MTVIPLLRLSIFETRLVIPKNMKGRVSYEN
jgi:hypothetical protein